VRFIYTLSINFYHLFIRLASLFNAKAKLWVNGRENIFEDLETSLKNQESRIKSQESRHKNQDTKIKTKDFNRSSDSQLSTPNSQLFWFHCASLGEFEQGRPLMEKLKKQNSDVKILLTFFSPSGYEVRKKYSGADWIFYLPIDTPSNAEKFISIVKPDAAFFVKYEFWFNYLSELKKNTVPTYLVSAIFREQQHFFKGYGNWFKKQLTCFNHFFVQDEKSLLLLKSIGYTNVTVSGDTRFDRVYEIVQNVKQIDIVKSFVGNSKVLIVGSAWQEDIKIIANWYQGASIKQQESSVNMQDSPNYKLIIAPHEVDEKTIQSIEAKFIPLLKVGAQGSVFAGVCLRYSQANEQNIKDSQILIIDNIGMLSSLYQYGTIAFIGGGFGKGIHNILEAATFGLPVIFGPNYEKFVEAKELIKLGGAFSVNDSSGFMEIIVQLGDSTFLSNASFLSKKYVESNIGATSIILKSI